MVVFNVKEIIFQQSDEFQTEVQGYLTTMSAYEVSRCHPSKVAAEKHGIHEQSVIAL